MTVVRTTPNEGHAGTGEVLLRHGTIEYGRSAK